MHQSAGIAAENYVLYDRAEYRRRAVPDLRLKWLSECFHTKREVPTTIEFVDIADSSAAATGEGLGNQFLGHIRTSTPIAHVVRCFEDDNVIHVDHSIDPIRDIETIETELILKDSRPYRRESIRHRGG